MLDTLVQPGPHERRLSEVFGARLRHDGSHVFATMPLVCLVFSNRCGSNLLAEHLRSVPGLNGFHEQLNFNTVETVCKREGLNAFPSYFEHLCGPAANLGMIYGFKASWDQIMMLKRQRIDEMFNGLRLIHMTRADIVGQAVSLSIADQTKQWTSAQIGHANVTPRYRQKQLHALVDATLQADHATRLIALYFNAPRLHVTYEELVADPAATVHRITDFLGIPLADWQPKDPSITKQAGQVNAQFRTRFMEAAQSAILN